ncbi:threonine/serine dehydratase [Acidaminobacter sp. JC074]|uniref:threonine ammonia-lyase n=1 Tax=Acidaminobacter sp. JC074 TaxID=2530199 RepID=UPI001F105246|nr:threonine/serine dehydratase [Acidaminobacter sp. JC074]MCH4886385.1 threonine/serine dehydratase [Acidaminobacter sp. JC074]
MFNLNDVKESYKRIRPHIIKTNLNPSLYLESEDKNYFLKLENMQIPRSFKIRGAVSKITSLTEEEKSRGVVAVSSGNHGAAVSYAGKLLGVDKVQVIVPTTTPQSKVDYIEYFGGKVIQVGLNYDEASAYAKEYIKEHNMVFVDACYNDPLIYAGQGTVAIEVLDQCPDIDTIIVPIGGGGLSTGVAVAAKGLKPDIRVIGVQTAACPAMIKSLDDHKYYEFYPSESSICDALIGGVGKLAYEMADGLYDDLIQVSEAYIRKGVEHLLIKEKVVAEPASAICVGAVLQNRERIGGKKIGLVITGGNLSENLMKEILMEGEVYEK